MSEISRRDLIKMAGVAAVGAAVSGIGEKVEAAPATMKISQAPVVGSKNVTGTNFKGSAAKVYFTKKIDAEHLIKLYNLINGEIYGKVALKLHTGEPDGPNIKLFRLKFRIQTLSKRILFTPAHVTRRKVTARRWRKTAGLFAKWTSWTSSAEPICRFAEENICSP